MAQGTSESRSCYLDRVPPSNWNSEQKGRKFKVEDAVQYLSELEHAGDEARATYDRAREYVINAPSQIQTPVRRMIREKKRLAGCAAHRQSCLKGDSEVYRDPKMVK